MPMLWIWVSIRFRKGMSVQLTVDRDRRMAIMRNHTATHLLNQLLRNHLGSHVVQQGSQVSDKTLRFDFNHYQNVTVEEILSIEKEVNQVIQKALPVQIKEMPIAEALKLGAQALFGEKYGEVVRVVDNQFSIELCGGTHVENTRDLKQFAILGLESKGSGVFRIEAATYPALKEQIARVTKATAENIAYLEIKLDRIIKEAEAEGIEIKKEPFPEFPLLLSLSGSSGPKSNTRKRVASSKKPKAIRSPVPASQNFQLPTIFAKCNI